MNVLVVLLQIRPVISVVGDRDLAVATFDLDALDSVRHSSVGTNNTFFREKIGKVP